MVAQAAAAIKLLHLKTGKYIYTLSDSSGNTLVEGEMLLNKMTKQVEVGVNNYLVRRLLP